MLKIREVNRSNNSRYKFRQLSRDVFGECFDIPEGNDAVFAHYDIHNVHLHIGCITFSLANLKHQTPETKFGSEYFHHITFMCIKRDYRDKGFGRQILNEVIAKMTAHASDRPVRVESAMKSAGFFEKMGFIKMGEPFSTVSCGPHLFRSIVNMEKDLSAL